MVLILGHSAAAIHEDVKELNEFLMISKDAKPNFEQSLKLYTDNTKEVIEYLLSLRPNEEEEFIGFIGKVEEIGQSLSLNINLESVEPAGKTDLTETPEKTLTYKISFYGSTTNLNEFLKALESLPYFIKIENIIFKSFQYEKNLPNIELTLKLYIK